MRHLHLWCSLNDTVLSVSDSWRGRDHYRTAASFLRPPPPPNLWASATWPLALALHTVDQGTNTV